MPALFVAQISIHDHKTYSAYEAGFMPVLIQYEGQVLAVDENAETIEGQWPATRTVILQFADREAARRWYDSAEYQAIRAHRTAASEGNIVLIDAFARPMP